MSIARRMKMEGSEHRPACVYCGLTSRRLYNKSSPQKSKGVPMENRGLALGKYSLGTGDRFAHQAKAQLQACRKAYEKGVEIVPVWNKSNREHTIIGSEPAASRQAAD